MRTGGAPLDMPDSLKGSSHTTRARPGRVQLLRYVIDERKLVAPCPTEKTVSVCHVDEGPDQAALITGVKSGMTGDLIGCVVGLAVGFSLLGGGIWLLRSDRVRARSVSSGYTSG